MRALDRDRLFVGAALAGTAALAWAYLLKHAATAHMSMPSAAASISPHWSAGMFALAAAMWAAMMVAMMLPAATPMALAFAQVQRHRSGGGQRAVPIALFVGGYLTLWIGFALAAAAAQWALHEAGLLSSAMGRAPPLFGAVLLIAAGAFQWSSLKSACLAKCRTPLAFLATEWREGRAGALVMGLRHGAFCAGCCWALMLLMFAGGLMNLAWMAALAAYMLAEKLVPAGRTFARGTGALLIAAGAILAAAALQ
jgi:predicted metal-binding membrane protein